MTTTEYRAACEALGLSLNEAGRFLGVHVVTSRRWGTTDEPPAPVAKLLRLMLALKFTPAYVDGVIRP
jgi:hypothetical protein